jgi:hypothetical protein
MHRFKSTRDSFACLFNHDSVKFDEYTQVTFFPGTFEMTNIEGKKNDCPLSLHFSRHMFIFIKTEGETK